MSHLTSPLKLAVFSGFWGLIGYLTARFYRSWKTNKGEGGSK